MQASEITVDGRSMKIIHHNDMCMWRAKTLLTKEPITIEWLNALGPKDLLYDVGANIGVYTLYASMIRHCPVVAFEPESQNYAALNANIHLNNPVPSVQAFCCAIGDHDGVDMGFLNLTKFDIGGSCHQQGDSRHFGGEKFFKPAYRQGSFGVSLASVMTVKGSPTAIKVDVDGHEHDVVQGYPWHLDQRPRTWIIEVNWNRGDHLMMVDLLEAQGYTWSQEQADAAKRTSGPFTNVGETVFTLEVQP